MQACWMPCISEAAAHPATAAARPRSGPAWSPASKTLSKTNDPADLRLGTELRTAATAYRPLHLAWRRFASSGPPTVTPTRRAAPTPVAGLRMTLYRLAQFGLARCRVAQFGLAQSGAAQYGRVQSPSSRPPRAGGASTALAPAEFPLPGRSLCGLAPRPLFLRTRALPLHPRAQPPPWLQPDRKPDIPVLWERFRGHTPGRSSGTCFLIYTENWYFPVGHTPYCQQSRNLRSAKIPTHEMRQAPPPALFRRCIQRRPAKNSTVSAIPTTEK